MTTRVHDGASPLKGAIREDREIRVKQLTVTSDLKDQPADIALVISDLGSGGAQRVVSTLANNWVGNGYHVCVVTFEGPHHDFFTLDPAIRRFALGGIGVAPTAVGRVLANLRRIRSLRRALQRADTRVVVSFILPTNILVILAGLGLESRIVVSERNDPARQNLGWHWNVLRRILYRLADVVTANTHAALEVMKPYVPASKLKLLPNPLTQSSCTDTQSALTPTIIAVGRLHQQKAYDVLVEAFSIICKRVPDSRLKIIGDGPLQQALRIQAEKSKVDERIDWVRQTLDPFAHYRSASVFVLASRYEGLPNSLLEAMSCGLPVVVSNASPGPLEYVDHEATGLVVPVEDPEALAAAIERLIRDPMLRQRLGEAARARVAECGAEHVLPVWEFVLGLPDLAGNPRTVR